MPQQPGDVGDIIIPGLNIENILTLCSLGTGIEVGYSHRTRQGFWESTGSNLGGAGALGAGGCCFQLVGRYFNIVISGVAAPGHAG